MDEKKQEHAMLGQIMANVAVQLRGALGNMQCALEQQLLQEESRGENDRSTAVLYQSYYRILRLVNNMTEAAELGEDVPLPLRREDVTALCARICRAAADAALLAGKKVVFRCAEEHHIAAVDPDGVERLLLNLLSNALKFSPAGGEVRVELRFENGKILLCVSDDGCGISQELLPTVFDRHLHLERMDPPPYGLGLGLPICHHIAKGHGGDIAITSVEGVGASVLVTLPDEPGTTVQIGDLSFDYAGGFNRTLLELSDALPDRAFAAEYLD